MCTLLDLSDKILYNTFVTLGYHSNFSDKYGKMPGTIWIASFMPAYLSLRRGTLPTVLSKIMRASSRKSI